MSTNTDQDRVFTTPSHTEERGCRISYLGSKGSYSYLATHRFFEHTHFSELHCQQFDEIIHAVEQGDADYGVLPIENTSSGSINEVYDLLQHTSLSIVGELRLPIEHAILAAVETSLEQINCFCSHPQPLEQCSQFLKQYPQVKLETYVSSADAMLAVADRKSPHIVAIGNSQSGALYGLLPVQDAPSSIANQQQNQTRFIIVAQKAISVSTALPTKTSFIMSTDQKAGALVDCLLVLRTYGISMTKLESRPIWGNPWEEMFYVDVVANLNDEAMQKALADLKPLTKTLSVLGSYPIEQILPSVEK